MFGKRGDSQPSTEQPAPVVAEQPAEMPAAAAAQPGEIPELDIPPAAPPTPERTAEPRDTPGVSGRAARDGRDRPLDAVMPRRALPAFQSSQLAAPPSVPGISTAGTIS